MVPANERTASTMTSDILLSLYANSGTSGSIQYRIDCKTTERNEARVLTRAGNVCQVCLRRCVCGHCGSISDRLLIQRETFFGICLFDGSSHLSQDPLTHPARPIPIWG
jgi:hypothetical protein